MSYIDRFLEKYSDTRKGGTDKTDISPPENLATPLGNHRQNRQTPPSVSFVSGSEEESPDFAPAALEPSSWRGCIALWPVEWRERWGRLANALEESGAKFPGSEAEAFSQAKTEMDQTCVSAESQTAATVRETP